MTLELDRIDRHVSLPQAIEQAEEILPPPPAKRRGHLGSGLDEHQHGPRTGRARHAERNIDVPRAERL